MSNAYAKCEKCDHICTVGYFHVCDDNVVRSAVGKAKRKKEVDPELFERVMGLYKEFEASAKRYRYEDT